MGLGSAMLLVMAACATPQNRADRAYEREKYQAAFDRYQEAIRRGTGDWKVYYRAARTASHVGDFGSAEKYYNRAIRNGGGAKVVRAFAEFYIQTSNYSRAVQLFRYLLEHGKGKRQEIYNNLGTALMYAGSTLQAESYLLLAQQNHPEDPVPYVNLGLLYDRHFQQPASALPFYRCYLKVTESSQQQVNKIRARISELQNKVGRSSKSRQTLACGEPYRPSNTNQTTNLEALRSEEQTNSDIDIDDIGTPPKRTREIELSFDDQSSNSPSEPTPNPAFDGETTDDGAAEDASQGGDASRSDETVEQGRASDDSPETETSSKTAEKSASARAPDPVIESVADEQQSASSSSSPPSDTSDGVSTSSNAPNGGDDRSSSDDDGRGAIERARMAWKHDKHERVVREISGLSLQSLDPASMRIYGLSLAELGRNEEAAQWLEWTVSRKPDPKTVERLLEVYRRLGREQDVESLCETYRGNPDVSEALESCPETSTSGKKRDEIQDEYQEWRKQKKKQESDSVIKR